MAAQTLLVLLAVQLGLLACAAEEKYTETVIIGAGPAGVQLSYYLEKAGRDYIALERNGVPGKMRAPVPGRPAPPRPQLSLSLSRVRAPLQQPTAPYAQARFT